MTSDINGTVTGIQGIAVSAAAPTTGQVLEFDGSEYVPTDLPSALPPSGAASGDLDGSYPNPSVVGLQGVDVSNASPADGYLLTYVVANNEWEPKPAPVTGLRRDYFTSNSTWTCPTGITNAILMGSGGGGGGNGGQSTTAGGGGGGAATQVTACVAVIPGNIYNITIGVGGSGGTANTNNAGDGGDTILDLFLKLQGQAKLELEMDKTLELKLGGRLLL